MLVRIHVYATYAIKKKESIYGPRRWKRSNCGGNSRPSNGANRRPRSSYSLRRQIPAAAGDGVVPAHAAGTGGMARSAAAEEAVVEVRNAEVASSGAALPSPPPDTVSPDPTETAAAAPGAAAAVDCASPSPAASNQNRSIASYLSLSLFQSLTVLT
jgi:hypothetical protein